MNALPLSDAKAKSVRGIVVDRPRTSDAVGSSLRNAFDLDSLLPGDMRALLQRLDGAPHR